MGFRRRTRRRALIAGAAVAHHHNSKMQEQAAETAVRGARSGASAGELPPLQNRQRRCLPRRTRLTSWSTSHSCTPRVC